MGSYRTLTLPLLSFFGWTLISAFNLDTNNVIRKTGDANSLFGFSLAMHRQLRPSDKRMLLVGAPRAKSLSKQTSTITGGMYNCDITSPSQSCQRVMFDNDENLNTENKQNQWMGVTLQSQGPGGKILVCAHRYQRRLFVNTNQELRDVTGRCYVLSQDLTINDASDEDGGDWMFCNGRNRGHERFGSCQQGLSATFTKDYHYLVFGAPGAYNWKGVVRMEQKNSSLWDENIFDDGPYEVGDESRLDPELVPVPANSYLGFSLDSGKMLTKRGQLTIVAGAPRANHSGAVVLLKKEEGKSSLLTAEYILEGTGLASSFGYDLAVLDINGDGWQDIVVGAPQYFIKDGDIGGAIYVYLNKEGAWDKITPKRIEGAANSMFGLAVESMGDVNLDGYHDVAVGAPYESNGAGNVYIFHGSTQGLTKSQVLEGKDHNVKLFGYSLAGNMDMDRNSYPDLAIGSLSDSVLVYRARSVISIEKAVTTTPKELDLTKKNCGDSICLDVTACFIFSANPKTYNPNLQVAYIIRVESERKKLNLPSRVIFTQSSTNEYESKGVVELKGQGTQACVTRGLRLQETLKDKLRGIPIEVSVEIQKPPTRRKRQTALPNLLPILDSSQGASTVTNVQFIKEGCGADHVCQSDLQLQYTLHTREPNRDIFYPLPEENGVPILSLSDQKDIALEINVKNKGEDAYEAQLTASFPKSLSYSAVRTKSSDKPISCLANQNGSQADCELGNPFKRDAETTFYIILSTGGISLETTEIEIDLKLKTTSDQKQLQAVKAKAIVKIQLLLSLTGVAKPSQVYFTGEVKGESAMKLATDVGSPIDYEFRVTNLGKPLKSFGTASMIIQWPKHNSQGKWLLYLMKITSTDLDSFSCSNQDEVNKLSLKEPSVSRTKREIGETPAKEGTVSLFTDKRKYTVLSCEDGAECITFKCPLMGMDSNAVISLRAYLWNATFLEEYSKLNYIDIIVKASLDFKTSATNIQLKNEPAQVRVTVFPERKVAQYGGMPWWVILVAILLGLLLLGLLVFLLYKCGFFKRSKYDDSVPSYNAVRIKREERDYMPGKKEMDPPEKKQWMTSWNENESYS
ncbi:integrin alpha-6b isoform X1 [Rhinichthys klamathensis goyatoka]|uniref:integrin alpha-6b isoform X1 n=1 Tax=Rhinichthys klamathensis goyatoka TaxID=3034132 RepID=UPI0024B571EC|nr:integrin alpha-6b isoform X1 [Rhinichthys klamathensis goyatoka]